MLNIKLVQNIERFALKRVNAMEKQMAFATSVALNNVGFDARKNLNNSTKQYFSQPVKFTQTAFLVKKSTKRNLITTVYANDQPGKGKSNRSRARYLRFGTAGGSRPQKGYEKFFHGAIQSDGTIPANSFFVPANRAGYVKIDKYGNVSNATLRSIGKGLKNPAGRGGFFMGTPKGGNRLPGIYRRSRKQLFPYFIATTDQPDYSKRFPITTITQKTIDRKFDKYFQTALSKAIATAR